MIRMIQTEIWKLKRYRIIWSGVFLMLLSVLLTIFSTTAMDGTIWTFPFFSEQVVKNNVTTIFPMCIVLIAGYIIAREEKDNALKNIMVIPVSYSCLLSGKLVACALLSLFLGLASAVFTIAASLLLEFPGFSVAVVIQTFIQMILNCLFLYIAVMPVIALTVRIPNGHLIGTIIAFVYGYGGMFASGNMTLANVYPITASLGLIRYRSYDPAVHWNMLSCLCSLILCVCISCIFILRIKNKEPERTTKKPDKAILKKGW